MGKFRVSQIAMSQPAAKLPHSRSLGRMEAEWSILINNNLDIWLSILRDAGVPRKAQPLMEMSKDK